MLKNQIMPDITDVFRPFRPDGRGLGLFGPFEECIKIIEHLVLTLNRYCILELKLNVPVRYILALTYHTNNGL